MKNQQKPDALPPAFVHYPPKKPELARVDFLPLATKAERSNGWVTVALVEAQQPAPSAAHVGDSLFESWFSEYNPAQRGTKQQMRDAYAAGMGDPKAQPAIAPKADSQPAKAELFNPLEGGSPETALQMAAVIALRDSQPAPQGETNAQLDTDSNSPTPRQQRNVAGPVAVGQSVGHGSDSTAGDPSAQGNKLLTVAERNIRSFLRSAVFKSESDRKAALNCVDVLWAAARAPADSVTAAAGGVVAYLDIGAGGYLDLGTDLSNEALSRLPKGRHALVIAGTYGIDGYTTTPPAQAADSVLEDAADPLQGAANWLVKAHSGLATSTLAGKLSIGYNRAKRLHDAARKQGGA